MAYKRIAKPKPDLHENKIIDTRVGRELLKSGNVINLKNNRNGRNRNRY